MFLEKYNLEANPFARGQVRPRIQSIASRSAVVGLKKLLDRTLYCLFLSGRSGVGKSALVERHLKNLKGQTVSLIGPGMLTAAQFIAKILRDVGLPPIDATEVELRNIIEVYLRHQIAKGVRVLLVVDSLERLAEPVLKELETLMALRFKHRPMMGFVLLTRSEELVQNMIPVGSGPPLAPYAHARLAGFTLDETAEYIMACLLSVDGQNAHQLFPEEVLRDVQAYTQGIVGSINSLCFEALNLMAQGNDEGADAVLDSALIAAAAERLNLRHDPSFSRDPEDELSAESIQQTDPGELQLQSAHLLVTSRGDVIAEIALNRPRMVLGRDESCDISLHSSYVSRYQNLFMETGAGWVLIDLGSTNGCFVNGRRVTHHELHDGDIIAVGHHQISFVGSRGRRAATRSEAPASAGGSKSADTLLSSVSLGKSA